jgi:hypothetical protein
MHYEQRKPIPVWAMLGVAFTALLGALAFLAVSIGLSLVLQAGVAGPG